MEVKVKLRTVTIKDVDTGKEFTVTTVRTSEEIAADLEETEKDAIRSRVEAAVWEIYHEEE